MLEAGIAGIQYLLQAKALSLTGFLTVPLFPTERSAIITALGIPADNYPVIIFSVSELVTEIKESNFTSQKLMPEERFITLNQNPKKPVSTVLNRMAKTRTIIQCRLGCISVVLISARKFIPF